MARRAGGRTARATPEDGAAPGDVGALERALKVRFHDDALARASLTHRSFAFEHGLEITNERLEFLGDAVLGLVVTDRAFRQFPDLSEGELAKLRAAAVNMTSLAEVSRDLGIGETGLQEMASQDIGSVPEYRVVSRGPDHAKEFTATVYLAGEQWGKGRGRSKKEAEQQAAREAFTKLVSTGVGGPAQGGE